MKEKKLQLRNSPHSWRCHMKHKSRFLEAVHETAQDLHELGFIDKRALNRYDALCIEPVPSYSAEQE